MFVGLYGIIVGFPAPSWEFYCLSPPTKRRWIFWWLMYEPGNWGVHLLFPAVSVIYWGISHSLSFTRILLLTCLLIGVLGKSLDCLLLQWKMRLLHTYWGKISHPANFASNSWRHRACTESYSFCLVFSIVHKLSILMVPAILGAPFVG